jgi:hypothetical protein
MALGPITGKPGTQAPYTATPIEIFYGSRPQGPDNFIPGPLTVDGNYTSDPGNTPYTWLVRAGGLVHKDATTHKYRTSIPGTLNGAITATTYTSLTVSAATAAEVARQILVAAGNVNLNLVGPPTANGTVATTAFVATAASGTTITITSVSLPACVSGSFISVATPTSIICDQWGLKVIDALNTTRLDVFDSELYAGEGIVDESKLILWPTDTSLQAWIKAGIRTYFPGARFKGEIINQ